MDLNARLDDLVAKVEELGEPRAFEALWDGDTQGWFLGLGAVIGEESHPLWAFSGGGDLRLFNGQVPPWPESLAARRAGEALARRYGVDFYFPSPDRPEDDCPSWIDRDKGRPCGRCGIPLLQREGCPWRGLCYGCHLDAEERASAPSDRK